MRLKTILIIFIAMIINTPILSQETNCNEFDKLSAKYIECTAKKLKEKASDEIVNSKKKIDDSGLGKKINKFKNSKTLSDFINS